MKKSINIFLLMEDKYTNILKMALYFVLGSSFCIAVGFGVYGKIIFYRSHPTFHFVIVGLAGAIIFTIVRFFRKWMAALLVLFLALLLMLILKFFKFPQVLFQTIWALTTGYLLFAMACLYRTRMGKIPAGKFALVGLALGLLYIVLAIGRLTLMGIPLTYNLLRPFAVFGFLIGCGLGLGAEIGELLNRFLIERISGSAE